MVIILLEMHALDAGTRVMVQLRKGLRVAGPTRRVLHGFSHQLASPFTPVAMP